MHATSSCPVLSHENSDPYGKGFEAQLLHLNTTPVVKLALSHGLVAAVVQFVHAHAWLGHKYREANIESNQIIQVGQQSVRQSIGQPTTAHCTLHTACTRDQSLHTAHCMHSPLHTACTRHCTLHALATAHCMHSPGTDCHLILDTDPWRST
jgi:hypothetical protein